MYEKEEKKRKSTHSSKRVQRLPSQAEEINQEKLGNTTIKLTSSDELIIMYLYSNFGYFLEYYPCDNLLGTFGIVEGMACFRIEQPIDLNDQLLYCDAMQKHFAPTLSYLARSRMKAQLSGYAYGRSFYVTNLQAVG